MTRHPKKASGPRAVVLADLPERNRLRELKAQLGERRDRIGELDLDIETLRDELAAFEASYRARVAEETAAVKRIEHLVLHLERWADLLREAPARPIAAQAARLEARRGRELAEQAACAPSADASPPPQEHGAAALPGRPATG